MVMYLNGEFVPRERATVPVDDLGLQFGFGFFETFRTCAGRPHLWRHHRSRLVAACQTAGLVVPESSLVHDETRLCNVVSQLLRGNNLEDAVFRYTITGGVPGEVPMTPGELMTLRPLPPISPPEGVVLRVLRLPRDNGEWVPRPKSLNYLNALVGRKELAARAADPSDEGLFLSREGEYVVETTHQNVAWVSGGRIRYPDPALGGVAGTALQWLFEQTASVPRTNDPAAGRLRAAASVATCRQGAGRQYGAPTESCRAGLSDLLGAEAIFVLNSVRGITPVRSVFGRDDQVLLPHLRSAGHPIIVQLREAWAASLAATGHSEAGGAP